MGSTAKLRSELEAALPDRPFELELWDGTRVPATRADATTFHARSKDAAAHMLRAPGQLGLGRAYVSGALEPDDLDVAIQLLDEWKPPPIDRATRARLAVAAARACRPDAPARGTRRRAAPARQAPQHQARRPRRSATTTTCRRSSSRSSSARSSPTAARSSPAARPRSRRRRSRSSTWSAASSTSAPGSACSTWAAAGAASRSTPPSATTCGCSASRSPSRRPRWPSSACASAGSRIAWRSGWPTTASCTTTRSTPWPASAWSSTWARARSTCTREQLAHALRPGGRLLNHGIARMRMGDPEAGPFSERYVFPDGAPLHLSRIQLAIERAGLVTDHVEGLHGNYAGHARALGPAAGRATWTRRSGWPGPSACASGGSTCAPPGAASRAASSPCTRCEPRAPAPPSSRRRP